jgi:hypothetical protein
MSLPAIVLAGGATVSEAAGMENFAAEPGRP